MATQQKDRVSTAVELGPRSLALLRRIVALLEQIVDEEMPDPGQTSEIDAEQTS